MPVLPYRAAGRPETTFAIERLIDAAAAETGIDRIEIRRKNMIPSAHMPKTTAMGMTYDVGDFPKALDMAAEMIDWPGFEARREAAAETGRLRGISAVPFVETPVGAPFDMARLEFEAGGDTVLFAGTQVHGQGHETTYAQVISDLLGVPFERIRLAQGDTDQLPIGGGHALGQVHAHDRDDPPSYLRRGGGRTQTGCRRASAIGRRRTGVRGRRVPHRGHGPGGGFRRRHGPLHREDGRRRAAFDDKQEGRIPAFPFGAAAAEVEIDPDTGAMEIIDYAIVDDCGPGGESDDRFTARRPAGSSRGWARRSANGRDSTMDRAQLLAGSFMDYVMPRADEYPMFDIQPLEVPTKGNPLGIKAGGEAGTVPALAVIGNAVMDALAPEGVEYFNMPYTAARIWEALNAAKAT